MEDNRERARPFKLYKGISGKWGALQLDLIPLERSQRNLGTVMITFANPKPDRTYDWENKVIMALNTSDIASILEFLENAEPNQVIDIYHDPKAGTADKGQQGKTLKIARGRTDGWFVGVTHRFGSEVEQEIKLPVKHGEMILIKELLKYAIPRILGW